MQDEREAVEADFKPLNAILNFVSFFVGTIMAIGATLGAVNSLYAMVDSRQCEIGTLRAIGFSPGAVVLAVLLESVLLALPGALLGSVLAWLLFNGLAASPSATAFDSRSRFPWRCWEFNGHWQWDCSAACYLRCALPGCR